MDASGRRDVILDSAALIEAVRDHRLNDARVLAQTEGVPFVLAALLAERPDVDELLSGMRKRIHEKEKADG